jgi:hypothetical protein
MNESEPLHFEPAGFGTILGNGFTLLGRTISNSGVLTLLMVIPFSILLTYGLSSYLTAIAGFVGSAESPESVNAEQIGKMMGPILLFYALVFLYLLAMLATQTATVLFAWEAAEGRRMGIGEALGRIIRKPLWIVLVQTVMILIIMMMAFFAFSLILAALVGGATAGDSPGAAVALVPVLTVLFGAGVVYFLVATIFRVHRVTIEDRGPWHGLVASIALVKGNWWRVFGLLFVIYLIVFAVSIPFFALIGDDLIDMSAAMRAGTANNPAVMAEFAENMAALFSWKFVVFQIVQGVATWLLLSNLLTAMYIDLRARRGEIATDDSELLGDTAWGESPQP